MVAGPVAAAILSRLALNQHRGRWAEGTAGDENGNEQAGLESDATACKEGLGDPHRTFGVLQVAALVTRDFG